MNSTLPASAAHTLSLPIAQAGERVVATSRTIGRNNVIVGTVTRTGTQLRVGELLLWDDTTGPARFARIIAREPARRVKHA